MLSDEGSLKYKQLQQAYRESFNAKRKELEECWQLVQKNAWSKESLDRLKFNVHRLAGSAAPYGFDAISEASSALEKLILDFLFGDLKEAQQHVIKLRITDSFRTLTETIDQENSANL